MAFKMTTEAADGSLRTDAYWVPVQINISSADRSGMILFYAYSSPEAMDSGKAPIAGAMKQYAFTQEEFLNAQMQKLSALFPDGITGNNILYEVLARFAYSTARNRKDVAVLNEDGTPKEDENGKPLMKSFFEDAVNV